MRRLLPLLAVVLLAGSCTLGTLGAPTGELTLIATFDNVEDLVPGHTVQVSNVVVGSVTKVELVDGRRAQVTVSIVDGRDIPVGSSVSLRRTSLLGEHFVDVRFPRDLDPATAPLMTSGDEFADVHVEAELELLTEQAAQVLGALAADDLAAIVDALATGLGGRGQVLRDVVDDLAEITDVLAGQRADLAAAIDGVGRLGAELEPRTDAIGSLIDDLAVTAELVAGDRERILATIDALVELATTTNAVVLEPHAERLGRLIRQLDEVAVVLAGQRPQLEALLGRVVTFTERIPMAVRNGQLLGYFWLEPGTLASLAPGGEGP